ncbi:MAG: Ku protein [Tardiphaga sp.]|uniref:non-homologous end joining protein Ku n=1 Tax=Tardiphaga sp. TaxID=1926292 RepID=UPI00260E9FD0|nr:Ku protein [Tardiphaga sp.]MDB5504697.1 Ku protein [Tardiphaga sp.]
MAPRANWKGFLRLSLVTCPGALFPATSDSEKISFNQINRNTGHRIKYVKVDADTGDEVLSEDIPKADIDPRYAIRPYYLVPDGKVGHDAYAVIRETIRSMNMVAIGRLVLTSREHIIALEPLKNGLMGTLLRYPYEVRSEEDYFDDIQDVKVTKDMLDLARHIVEQKSGEFEPGKFEDRYEAALVDLVNSKRNGTLGKAKASPRPGTNVVDLMTALQQSLKGGAAKTAPAKNKKPAKATGQREMLLPIAGKKAAPRDEPKTTKPARSPARTRRAS